MKHGPFNPSEGKKKQKQKQTNKNVKCCTLKPSKKFLRAFDLKWFLETDDQGRTPVTTLERRFCKSRACKQDTSTFMKPKAAC